MFLYVFVLVASAGILFPFDSFSQGNFFVNKGFIERFWPVVLVVPRGNPPSSTIVKVQTFNPTTNELVSSVEVDASRFFDGRLALYRGGNNVNFNYQYVDVSGRPAGWYMWVGPILTGSSTSSIPSYAYDQIDASPSRGGGDLCIGWTVPAVLPGCSDRTVRSGGFSSTYKPIVMYIQPDKRLDFIARITDELVLPSPSPSPSVSPSFSPPPPPPSPSPSPFVWPTPVPRPDPSLVLYWKLDESSGPLGIGGTATDYSGSGNDGTHNGGQFIPSQNTQDALNFPEEGFWWYTNSYTSMKFPVTMLGQGSSFSFRVTFDIHLYDGIPDVIFGSSSSEASFSVNGARQAILSAPGFGSVEFSLPTLQENKWYSFVLARPGGSVNPITLYLNGEPVNINSQSGDLSAAITFDQVGRKDALNEKLRVYLDEVRIYSRGLAAWEAKRLAERRDIGYYETPSPEPRAYWPLDEAAGDIGYDVLGSYAAIIHKGPKIDALTLAPLTFTSNERSRFYQGTSYATISRNIVLRTRSTLSAWFLTNFEGGSGTGGAILGADDSGSVALLWRPNKVYVLDAITSQNAVFTTTGYMTPNVWHHIAIVRDVTGTNQPVMRVLIDNREASGNSSFTGDIVFNQVGRQGLWSYPFFNNYVDDVRLYNRSLSDAEVGALSSGADVPL